MLCLSSQYPEIRSQALTQLHKFWGKVDISSSEYRLQFCFLILELIETYEKQFQPSATALPYLVSCFATHALEVEKQPIHFMYPKINEFLNKKPEWQTKKLPTYWLDNTVLSQPEEDDAYWKEFLWVLDWLVDGLRTRADLDILRKAGILERVMALYASPGAEPVKEKVLELVWRVTWVEEGSNTLITRMGVLAWLEMTSKLEGKASLLKKRVLESCDMERVNEWTGIGPNVLS
jgi:nucleolar pre-ribosomal-associated protein 1